MAEPSVERESNMLPRWACNICLEEVRNAVCTTCGHLFCWSCLHPWVVVTGKPCHVCRASITLGSIVPIYGSTAEEAGKSSLPPRPHPAVIRPPPQRPQRPRRFHFVEIPGVDTVHETPRFRATKRVIDAGQTERREQFAREEEQINQNLNSFQGEDANLSRMRQRAREMFAMNTVALSGAQTSGASSH